MRAPEFRDYLLDLLKNTPGVQAADRLEDGKHPYAVRVTAGGREQRWQILQQLAEGAKHDTPTAPVTGTPAAFVEAPLDGPADAWLGGAIGAGGSDQVQQITVWSTREGDSSTGVTVLFHNGERAFLRAL
ncbi:hypothetical protein ACFW9D_05940 [Streptomyces sp. NPDC059524]|uniref:hypothetical protein n=1 Tax=Streptomyces sp. NPDC059524 TaxID=3346856 RepID=UPI0036778E6B